MWKVISVIMLLLAFSLFAHKIRSGSRTEELSRENQQLRAEDQQLSVQLTTATETVKKLQATTQPATSQPTAVAQK